MEKIKQFLKSEQGKDILIVIIVLMVGLGSFILGRFSKESASSTSTLSTPTPTEEYQGQNQDNNNTAPLDNSTQTSTKISGTTNISTTSINKNFFASTRGSKYYPLGCSAGKTIKQENRVYFATGEEAVAAGYTLSSACN